MCYAYVGSFNYTGSEGIHICEYREQDGTIEHIKTVAENINPGSLTVYGDFLFATDEGERGLVYVYKIEPKSGELTQINCIDTLAVNPSHITIDSSGQYAIVTHFSVGMPVRKIIRKNESFESSWQANDSATCLFRLDEKRGLSELLDIGLHEAKPGSMTMVHKAYEKNGSGIFAENDLGQNRIYFFRIREEKLEYISSISVAKGQEGPRHGVFHPILPYLYINYEHKGCVSKLDISDLENIKVSEEIELLCPNELLEDKDNQSELLFHPNGKILYAFMRGKGTVNVIHIDEISGCMSMVQRFQLPGDDPRGAVFSPDGRYILVEGHNSNAVYTLDVMEDGTLSFYDKECCMEHPACLVFYEGA